MASPGRIPSSPPKGASLQEELSYYKAQYEQVELELQEFQNSSKELEAELEKDVEESEKRERALREKAESLRFEVEEWKEKYKNAKSEANNAQSSLQKEITTLRDANRTLTLQVRDVEVQNDDFERQARNQTSSLEDLESKYNVSIERGVLLEEEIKIGEQEREGLRIENQRLRDEYSELKVEAEIVQGKLKRAEDTITKQREKRQTPPSIDALRPRSAMSEASTSVTTTSSPSLSTPPPSKSEISTLQTSPPSPPISNGSTTLKKHTNPITPVPNKTRMLPSTTPRISAIRPPRHSRGPSMSTTTPTTTRTGIPITPRIPTSRLSVAQERPTNSSRSLNQIRGLIGRMQKLEERVHTTRSKLPAPTSTPPRSSPRNADGLSSIPSTVTVRSARKRVSNSTNASSLNGEPTRSASRLSFGFSPTAAGAATSNISESISRPSSRASHTADRFVRPSSRASVTGRTTPFADIPTQHRPRSSISGNYASIHGSRDLGIPRSTTPGPRTANHSFSRSVSAAVGYDAKESSIPNNVLTTPLTARRTTLDRGAGTGIPTPTGLTRRQSGGMGVLNSTGTTRRQSGAGALEGVGEMRPPSSRGLRRQMSEIGERY